MLLSGTSWHQMDGENQKNDINEQIQQSKDAQEIPDGLLDQLTQMNKSSLGFGHKQASLMPNHNDADEFIKLVNSDQKKQRGETIKSKGNRQIQKRQDSSKLSSLFDPDHGPGDEDDQTQDRAGIDESDAAASQPYNPALKTTFGGDSFDDRDNVSVSDAANKYY